MPKFLKVAMLIVAILATLACGLSVQISGGPALSGESVSFTEGEEKYFANGDVFVSLTYNGEGKSWDCQDNVGGEACDVFSEIGAIEDAENPGTLFLFEGWSEMEEVPPEPPLETDSA